MRTLSMFLTIGILIALGIAPAEAATTTNSYATATTSSRVDPGVRANVKNATFGSTCSSILVGRDSMPLAVCTSWFGGSTIYLFDRSGSRILATKDMNNSATKGTMPTYLDDHGWLVIVNGDRVIWRVVHLTYPDGTWYLGIGRSAVLTGVIGTTDSVVGLQPDRAGRVWFATKGGVVGTVDTEANSVRALRVKKGEHVVRDLSTRTTQIVATTDKAVYRLGVTKSGAPRIMVRTAR